MSDVRLATPGEIGELAGVLARAFVHDPFYAYLAGDAPERTQRMRDGWVGILRFTSDGLSTTYTTDDHAGVALWHPPGYDGAGFIDSLRLLPSVSRSGGGLPAAATDLQGSRGPRGASTPPCPDAPLLPVRPGRRAGAPG